MALSSSQASQVDKSLQEAINEFQSALTESQRKEFRNVKTVPDADTVITFTAQLDIANPKRKGNSIASRFYSFLQSIQQFTSVVDTFVSSNPNIAALVWGSVKFTLLVTVNFVSYFEELSNLFMSFNKFCPRFAEYQILYPHKPRLQRALCAFHASIIRCCTKALGVAQRPWQTQVLNALWRSSMEEFAPYKAEIQKCSAEVTEEIALAKAQADSQDQQLQILERKAASTSRRQSNIFFSNARIELDDMKQWRMQREERRAKERRERLLNSLSNHDHITPFKQTRKKRHNGTAQWLSTTASFIDWVDQPESSVFWCSGKLGSGKTVLTSSVVDYLFLEKRRAKVPVTFFFPRYDEPESLKAENILRSITRQCLDSSLISKEVESDLLAIEHDSLSGLELVTKLLQKRVAVSQTFYLVIDALDECEKYERDVLLNRLSLLSTAEVNLKIFFASRDSLADEIRRHFSSIYHTSMSCVQAQSDIATYIKETIDARIHSEVLVVGDTNIVQEIQGALIQGAQGMFLWVSFQLDDICSQYCDEDIREVLKNLPKDLTETFNRSLRRILRRGNAKVAQQIFPWIAAAKRPLLLDELREAISIEPGQRYFKPERLVNGISRITAWCENLVQLDEELDTVQFAHHTVLKYLMSDAPDPLLGDFHFQLNDVDHYIGEICVTYLDLNNFKTALARYHKSLPFPTPSKIAEAALGDDFNARLHTSIWSLIHGQYSTKSVETDVTGLLTRYSGKDRFAKETHFEHPFLDYACSFWLLHTKEFESTKTKSWTRWMTMMSGKHELAPTPWTAEEFSHGSSSAWSWCSTQRHWASLRLIVETSQIKKSLICGELYSYVRAGDIEFSKMLLGLLDFHPLELGAALSIAVEFGRIEIIEMLLAANADPNTLPASITGHTALQEAAGSGHLNAVEMLLAANADVNAAGVETALYSAARHKDPAFVQKLLEAGAEVNAKGNHFGQTALQLAVKYSRFEVTRMLLEAGADVNAGIEAGQQTALQLAVKYGSSEMVKLLLKAGADVKAGCGNGDLTAIHLAARYGRLGMLKMLLEAKDDIKVGTGFGFDYTALHVASQWGHLDVVKCLLEAGAAVNAGIHHGKETALHLAAKSGQLDVVNCLLEAGAVVDAGIHHFKETALQLAAKFGHLNVAKCLLEAGADVSAGADNGHTALILAAEKGYTEMVEMLLAAEDDENPGSLIGRSFAIQLAAKGGYLKIVTMLLAAKADVNVVFGQTALIAAAAGGHSEIVEILIAANADVNIFTGDEPNALTAAAGGYSEIVEILIAANADVNFLTNDKPNALTAAAAGGYTEIVDMLIAAKADVNAVSGGTTALIAAAEKGYLQIVDKLIAAKADVTFTLDDGQCAIHAAKDNRRWEVITRLISEYPQLDDATGEHVREALEKRHMTKKNVLGYGQIQENSSNTR